MDQPGRPGGAPGSEDNDDGEPPLSDLRVLEIGYGVAAPTACRTLAEFGADVIRVESVRRPDSLRTAGAGWLPPQVPWEIQRDTGISMLFTCPEKRSIGLEIDTEEGRQVFLRLVAASDVLVMNISVDAVERLRLGYEELRAVNPGLVYVNLYAFGSGDGPYRSFRTWGGNLSGLAGLTHLSGWPDRPPAGMPLSFPDYPSALWAVIAVVAAILRRDATGQGCEIDLSQFQVAISAIGPTVAEASLTGRAPAAAGNRAAGRAPSGVYPTREADRYVAVSVPDQGTWERLRSVEGLEELGDARFTSVEDRLALHDEIDEVLSAWTGGRTAWEVAWELQGVGVPAFPVVDHWELLGDEHLAARRFFRVLPSRRFGAELTYGQAVVLSETPARFTRAAPAFGEHTRAVLGDLAGLDGPEIDRLVAEGVAHEMGYPDLELERPFLHWIPHLMRLAWPAASVSPAEILFERLARQFGEADG